MSISIVVAIGKNNEIGKKGELLWRMPADLKHFKKITEGHSIIMGRKTFESIGRPLPNRTNIVITRNKKYKTDGIILAHSLKEALKVAQTTQPVQGRPGQLSRAALDTALDSSEVFVIGGGEIYKEAFPLADKLYVTEIKAEDKKADTFFPEIIPIEFLESKRDNHKKDDKNPYDYDFVEYDRFF